MNIRNVLSFCRITVQAKGDSVKIQSSVTSCLTVHTRARTATVVNKKNDYTNIFYL